MSSVIEKAIHEKPSQLALIREAECIGCTKCIQACPFDAIMGGAKQVHTVLMDMCTGCGLCVIPCPVDCIDMVDFERLTYHPNQARERFNAHKLRVENKPAQTVDAAANDIAEIGRAHV